MEKTPKGTAVGVEDPYAIGGRCDHVTGDGRCRFAADHAARDPEFARQRRREGYACPVVEESFANGVPESGSTHATIDREAGANEHGRDWRSCPHYRSRTPGRQCRRCGLDERRTTVSGERPLLEEHHLSYADRPERNERSHEITISLCRWCHAKVHRSWARVDDEVRPDPEAIAAREGRRLRERAETGFMSAAERRAENESTD